MEAKKTEKADLQNKKFIFGEIGLVITLLIVWGVFEISTKATKAESLGQLQLEPDNVIEIEITKPKEPELPPPPKAKIMTDIIEIVETEKPIEDDFFFDDLTEDASIEITQVENIEPAPEEDLEEVIFVAAEKMPEFKGNLMKYISEHVVYPETASENDIQGTVNVQFVVDETGKVVNVRVVKSVDPLLDNEAVRVIKNLPKWKPGSQSGKNVKVSMVVPIKFKLQ
ncbi:MAG: energy transducer TonB [Bacteroidales bacterium]|nr:energy transducer TonB [Bacteroidales bacterium]